MPSSRRGFLTGTATFAGAGLLAATTRGRATVSGSWPEYGRTPANTGRTSARGPLNRPAERWHHDTGIPVRKTPTAAGGRVFVGGLDRMLALDAATGKRVWSVELDERSRFNETAAAIEGGRVFVPFSETLYAFDAADGTERWSRTLADGIRPPTVVGETVYALVGDGGTLLALDRDDGEERWRADVSQFSWGAPAVVDGVAFATGASRSGPAVLAAFDASDGTERWRYEVLASGEDDLLRSTGVAVADGRAYVGSRDGSVHAVRIRDGSRAWRFDPGTTAPVPEDDLYSDREPRPARIRAGVAVADGTVYVVHGDTRLYALDAATGEVRWSFRSWGRFSAAPSVGEGAVYAASEDTFVYALDPGTGERLWEFSLPARVDESAPAVVDGHLFVGCSDDRVYAIREEGR